MKKEHAADLLGRRIRSLRRANSLTQEELAATCGINYKHLGAIERGEENPSLSILSKVAEGLGVEILELFRFQHEEMDPIKLKELAIDIISQIDHSKREKMATIVRILKALK